jgi:hypothetical protein
VSQNIATKTSIGTALESLDEATDAIEQQKVEESTCGQKAGGLNKKLVFIRGVGWPHPTTLKAPKNGDRACGDELLDWFFLI